MNRIKLLVVDDNKNFRNAVKSFLISEPDIELIGEAEDGDIALLKSRELKPDIILMDIRMPKMNGREAAKQIRKEFPYMGVIFCTLYDEEFCSETNSILPADAFLLKKSLAKELIPIIKKIIKQKLKQDQ